MKLLRNRLFGLLSPFGRHLVVVDVEVHEETTICIIAAEFGPEFAIVAPDVAEAFPDSDAVNAVLRALLDAAKTVRKATSKKKRARAA